MRLLHAAALALVSWYLMVPVTKDTGHVESNLPLSEWSTIMTFQSKEGCQSGFSALPRTGGVMSFSGDGQNFHRLSESTLRKAQCIASDDPRLKESP